MEYGNGKKYYVKFTMYIYKYIYTQNIAYELLFST